MSKRHGFESQKGPKQTCLVSFYNSTGLPHLRFPWVRPRLSPWTKCSILTEFYRLSNDSDSSAMITEGVLYYFEELNLKLQERAEGD